MTIADGATLVRWASMDGILALCDCVTTQAFSFGINDSFQLLDFAVIVLNTGALVPAIDTPASNNSFTLTSSLSTLDNSLAPTIPVVNTESGAFTTFYISAAQNLEFLFTGNEIGGPPGSIVYWENDPATAPLASALFSGTINQEPRALAQYVGNIGFVQLDGTGGVIMPFDPTASLQACGGSASAGQLNVSLGSGCISSGSNSFTAGYFTQTAAQGAVALGYFASATALGAFAGGAGAASGVTSCAFGESQAQGLDSAAFGKSHAVNTYDFSANGGSRASGGSSAAFNGGQALDPSDFACVGATAGSGTSVGNNFATGYGANALGGNSVAIGPGATAANANQTTLSDGGGGFNVACTSLGFFTAPAVTQQVGGAAVAGPAYTAVEQGMLNAAYAALRAYGLLT